MESHELISALEGKAQRLSQQVWPRDLNLNDINKWVANFSTLTPAADQDLVRRHCLYVLTHIVAFRERELSELLRALYREYVRLPLVYEIRTALGNGVDPSTLAAEVRRRLAATLFVGLGSPAKSGAHLLYPFVKQASLSDDQVVASCYDLLTADPGDPASSLRHVGIDRYVFIDDMCGTGESALGQLEVVKRIRKLSLDAGINPRIQALFLFGTLRALADLRAPDMYDDADALMMFTESHRTFGPESRYFQAQPAVEAGLIDKEIAERLFRSAGDLLLPAHPLGYMDGQLLLAFQYNTPDNTMTAVWCRGPDDQWFPIFERFM